jgi:murein DD-endopeptidase MepM/ murein hydrolase activator NlpD
MPPHAVTRWAPEAARAHRRYRRVPTRLLLGLIQTESSGQEGQVSPGAHAEGLTQFIPSTARTYHVNTKPGHARSQIMGAAHYLSDLIGQTGSINSALLHYSGGLGSYPGLVRGRAKAYANVARRANQGLGIPGGKGAQGPQGPKGSITIPGVQGPNLNPFDMLQQLNQFSAGGDDPNSTSSLNLNMLANLFDAQHAGDSSTPNTILNFGGNDQNAKGGNKMGNMPGGHHYPLGHKGKLIGTPYSGTHTLGNWQSDNAIDLGVPVGTPVLAVVDGVISPGGLGFGPGGSGRFAGDRLHLRGGGNTYFYTHMKRYAKGIRPGARVRRGQIIGYSGSANGVAHLHFAQQHGDPRRTIRR